MKMSWIPCLMLGLVLPAGIAVAQTSPPPPNVVFIIADDMDRDMVNGLPEGAGNNVTPNIDRLFAEGTVFYRQHVVSPACTPSRYNMLTGRYGSRARNSGIVNSIATYNMPIVGWNTKILPDEQTLPKLLQGAGYATGFVGKDHVVNVTGYNSGIDENGDPNDPAIQAQLSANQATLRAAIQGVGFDYAESLYRANPVTVKPTVLAVHNLDWITQGGLDFIDQYKHQPFFLYFSTTSPHVPRDQAHSWGSDPLATPDGYLPAPLNVLPDRSTIPTRLTDAGLAVDTSRPQVTWLDDAVGALFNKLEAENLDHNTIVFFFNDHGTEDGKSSCYQGGTLSLGIVWQKGGFATGTNSQALVSNVDFAPTILDFAGVNVPLQHFDGRSLRPILEGRASSIHESLYFEMGCARGVRIGDWTYISVRYPSSIVDPVGNAVGQVSLTPGGSNLEIRAMTTHPGYFDSEQLYNLAADPTEQNNLAAQPEQAARLATMQAELRKHLQSLPGPYAEFKTSTDALHQGSTLEIF